MNSVALPAAGAGAQLLSVEADLVRQAARGDANAFAELFRRHSAPAWRLAQAITADRESAIGVFRDGFVRGVRSSRNVRRGTAAFRLQVLAAVYRSATDHTYERPDTAVAAVRSKGSPEAALADAAFRSLPERWRAAIWLSEVENFDSERTAIVLGVSAGVAEQLVARGLKGLAGRYEQARRAMPDHIGEVLRRVAVATPADLAELTQVRWALAGADRLTSLVPLARWMDDHAARPLSVAAGALIGLGLIGLGVIPGGSGIHSQLGATGTSSVLGAQPIAACVGNGCPPGSAAAGAGAGAGAKSTLSGASAFALAFDRTVGLGGQGSGLLPLPGTTLTGTTPAPPVGSPGNPTGPGTPTPPVTGPQNPPVTGPTPLGIPGVATFTLSGGSLSTTLLNGTVTATAGKSGVSATAGGTCAGTCSSTSSTTGLSPVTNTVQQAVTATSGTVTSVVGSVTNTVGSATSTATTVPPATKGLLSGL